MPEHNEPGKQEDGSNQPTPPRYPIGGILFLAVVGIAAVLFLALGGPRALQTAASATSVFAPTAVGTRLGIAAQQVDVYTEPDSKGTLVATYRKGAFIEQVEILETQDPIGLDWYHIRFLNNGARAEGWVNKYWVFLVQ